MTKGILQTMGLRKWSLSVIVFSLVLTMCVSHKALIFSQSHLEALIIGQVKRNAKSNFVW